MRRSQLVIRNSSFTRLTRRLDRELDRPLDRWSTTMLGGARRPRKPDDLALSLRCISECLRIRKRMAKADPHLFGPHAHRYFLDTLQLERQEQEIEAAIRKVYGPPPPGTPPRVSTLWTDRYYPRPEQRRLFLKWFHECYPSK